MSTNRNIVLANGEIYHVFNRGIDRRPIFTAKREYQRMLTAIWFYQYTKPGANLSQYLDLGDEQKRLHEETLEKKPLQISLLSYCLMPNHFHLVVRQEVQDGIRKFLANITNSYTKYFNLKRKRVGPLLQGTFKAVWVETDEQFLHLTRYVHLNPMASYLCKLENLPLYPWSSYREYLSPQDMKLCNKEVLQSLMSFKNYAKFVKDQAEYSRNLKKIKHLTLDEES